MTLRPVIPRARVALDALTLPAGDLTRLLGPFASVDAGALRELLVALHCGPACVGVINDAGWHRACERAADEALEALDAGWRLTHTDGLEVSTRAPRAPEDVIRAVLRTHVLAPPAPISGSFDFVAGGVRACTECGWSGADIAGHQAAEVNRALNWRHAGPASWRLRWRHPRAPCRHASRRRPAHRSGPRP